MRNEHEYKMYNILNACNNAGSINESTVEYGHPSVSVGMYFLVPIYGQPKRKQAKVSVCSLEPP